MANYAAGGECPIQIHAAPQGGHSRFGCWTCIVVERDKASEGLLASGDARMEPLIPVRQRLFYVQDPSNGFRDTVRMNGSDGNGPRCTISAGGSLTISALISATDRAQRYAPAERKQTDFSFYRRNVPTTRATAAIVASISTEVVSRPSEKRTICREAAL